MKCDPDELILLDRACAAVLTTIETVTSRSRQRPRVDKRHLVFFLLRKHGMSLHQVSRLTQHDHSTVLYGQNRMAELAKIYPEYAARVQTALATFNPITQ